MTNLLVRIERPGIVVEGHSDPAGGSPYVYKYTITVRTEDGELSVSMPSYSYKELVSLMQAAHFENPIR